VLRAGDQASQHFVVLHPEQRSRKQMLLTSMKARRYHVLFLCTGNSARSIMAEALASTMGNGRFKGFSAGSMPTGRVNPFAIEKVKATGYAAELRSKSWNEFAGPDAPHMDFIITVCDNAAGEACPRWPGHPATAHWGFEDPAAVDGTDDEKRAAFDRVFRQIETCIAALVALPVDVMEDDSARQAIRQIGEMRA
jgi:arsenate reductase (thioredoxin)